jgi:hypothetical protein
MERTALLRAAILRILDANNSRWGLSPNAVAIMLAAEGFAGTPESEAREHLDWLLDHRWVLVANSPLDPTGRHYRITAEGRHQI